MPRTFVRVLWPVVVILLVVLPALPACAEKILSFDANIALNTDCSLDVSEDIKMDFEDSERHGIKRWIPVRFKRWGGSYTVELKVLSITDKGGQPYEYQITHHGNDVNIRIGSPNHTITGVHDYRLHYLVKRAVNFFQNAPEVYWNVTGNESPFSTERVSARFRAPPSVNLSQVRTACYAGPQGSRTPGSIKEDHGAIVFSAKNLAPGEGLTIVAGLPAGSVVRPSAWQEFLWLWNDWWPLAVFPIGVSYILYITWWYSGRDEDGGKPVAVEWNPPKDLSPAEVGTLVDESCDMQDIVSTLIDLAARGYLKIKEVETGGMFLFFSDKDYRFTKIHKERSGLLPHEHRFLEGLFPFGEETSRLSELRNKFAVHLPEITDSIYGALVDKGHFLKRPDHVRSSFQGMAVVVMLLGIFAAIAVSQLALGGGLMISGLIIFFSSKAMPARTRSGSEKLREILGFQRFVSLTEKRRIAELAKDDPTVFGRLLPYAMVLGVADHWAGAFQDLLKQPPDWYEPYGYGPDYIFSPRGFVDNLGGAMHVMGSTFSAAPPAPTSSSAGGGGGFSGFGGGFSGGGFGGGGTDSW